MKKEYNNHLQKVYTSTKCPKCGTAYEDGNSRMYTCPNCGFEEPTTFGIVRTYLEEHGNRSAIEISRDTKIPVQEINSFLRQGRLEIPEESDVFIDCKRCGISIRYGKFCPACAEALAKELKEAFDITTVGPVPKSLQGKMHSLNQAHNKRQ